LSIAALKGVKISNRTCEELKFKIYSGADVYKEFQLKSYESEIVYIANEVVADTVRVTCQDATYFSPQIDMTFNVKKDIDKSQCSGKVWLEKSEDNESLTSLFRMKFDQNCFEEIDELKIFHNDLGVL
jgi:hypothetical protein